jgi:hypothetical protein
MAGSSGCSGAGLASGQGSDFARCVCVCVCVHSPLGRHACWLAADVLYLYVYLYFYLRACTHTDVYMYAIYSYMYAHEMLHR